ncbi:hypothetical protein OUZ56_028981 [Daphnia magna]|uniref:EF-hand domain-containing protein n=1 Tax=Daphnia magna TaxID=35525 RepID=A0ABR0B5H1_9CRUS|nr:hypothetical protein OUZ56_028981 [Daphnia magna]
MGLSIIIFHVPILVPKGLTSNVVQRKLINHDVCLVLKPPTFATVLHASSWTIGLHQVRGYFDRQIDKLKLEGAFITDKIDEDHARLVEQIFETEDKNKDGVITRDEFSGETRDEL